MSVFCPVDNEPGNVRVKTGNFEDKVLGNSTVQKINKKEIILEDDKKEKQSILLLA